MTREDFVVRWRTRLSEWARIGALVDGARVCEDVLQDFEAVTRAEHDAELSLSKAAAESGYRSEEHTSELQSQSNLVCRLLLEKKKNVRRQVQSVVGEAQHEVKV